MAELRFTSGSGNLEIEVETVGSGANGDYAAELGKAIAAIAEALAAVKEQADSQPSELSVECRLLASNNGGFVIPTDPEKGNFLIRAVWTAKQEIPTETLGQVAE